MLFQHWVHACLEKQEKECDSRNGAEFNFTDTATILKLIEFLLAVPLNYERNKIFIL